MQSRYIKPNDSSIHYLKEKESEAGSGFDDESIASGFTQNPVGEEKAEKTVEESVVAPTDETLKNPGNMKPRRVAMLNMADKEDKKKVRKERHYVLSILLLFSEHDL